MTMTSHDATPTPLDVHRWLRERMENCRRIAATKHGKDRDGWLEDERYFAAAIANQRPALAEENAQMRDALIMVANIGSGEAQRIALETLRSIDDARAALATKEPEDV